MSDCSRMRCVVLLSSCVVFIHSFISLLALCSRCVRLSPVHSLVRSFTCSFIHPFIHSFIYSFIHSFIHFSACAPFQMRAPLPRSFARSLSLVHSFIHPSIHSFVRSFIHFSPCIVFQVRAPLHWVSAGTTRFPTALSVPPRSWHQVSVHE